STNQPAQRSSAGRRGGPVTITDNDTTTDHDGEEVTTTDGADAAGAVPDELIDAVMANVDANGVELLGPDGVLAELTKRILERGLSEDVATPSMVDSQAAELSVVRAAALASAGVRSRSESWGRCSL